MLTSELVLPESIRSHKLGRSEQSLEMYSVLWRFIIGKLPNCISMQVDTMLIACSVNDESKCINPLIGQLNCVGRPNSNLGGTTMTCDHIPVLPPLMS